MANKGLVRRVPAKGTKYNAVEKYRSIKSQLCACNGLPESAIIASPSASFCVG